MTLRIVTTGCSISYGGTPGLNWPQTDTLLAGAILDVIPGSALETALGSNIALLSPAQLANELNGSDGQATGNM
jgi:hypothetical protein